MLLPVCVAIPLRPCGATLAAAFLFLGGLAAPVSGASGASLELALGSVTREAITHEDGPPGVRWDYVLTVRNRGPQPVVLLEDQRRRGPGQVESLPLSETGSVRLEPGEVWRGPRTIRRFTTLKASCRDLKPEIEHAIVWQADGTRGEERLREVLGWPQAAVQPGDLKAPLRVEADVLMTNEVPRPDGTGRIFERRYDIRVAAPDGIGVTIERVRVEGAMRFTHSTSVNGPLEYPMCFRLEGERPTHWQTWYTWAVQDILLPLLVDAQVRYTFLGQDDLGRAREGSASVVLLEPRQPVPPR